MKLLIYCITAPINLKLMEILTRQSMSPYSFHQLYSLLICPLLSILFLMLYLNYLFLLFLDNFSFDWFQILHRLVILIIQLRQILFNHNIKIRFLWSLEDISLKINHRIWEGSLLYLFHSISIYLFRLFWFLSPFQYSNYILKLRTNVLNIPP